MLEFFNLSSSSFGRDVLSPRRFCPCGITTLLFMHYLTLSSFGS
jgi:hypothetical protein